MRAALEVSVGLPARPFRYLAGETDGLATKPSVSLLDEILARVGETPLEVVARWAKALERGDLGEDCWGADCVIVNAKGWPVEATYRGHDGLRRWWDDLAEAFSEYTLKFEEMTPLDGERVLTTQRAVGTFSHTGIPFDGPWASVITVREGRIVQAVGYLTKGRALRAVSAVQPRRSS